ncbi:MAG TPA: putative DNA binding domain-containing protein [Methanocorpusculum sp.]|nr:putative DNA binding domain-containing protein [Methanocorpusculum sp.]
MVNIGLKEGLKIEFKRDVPPLQDSVLADVVVSFANTEGGVLYIGVDDDGEISGLHPCHENHVSLGAVIANNTNPPVNAGVEKIEGDVPYIMVTVPKNKYGLTATSGGKILRRQIKTDGSPEMVPVYPYEILSRLSGLGCYDYSMEVVPGAACQDLDSGQRERLRKIIKEYGGDTALLDLSDSELDKALGFVKSENGHYVPTVTGLLMIGKEASIASLLPTADTAFQVMEGSSVRVNVSWKKPVLEIFELISEYMRVWNPEREILSGMYRISVTEFNIRAFREALVNAFCHRDYAVLGRVRVLIDDYGLTISSPGGFIEGVTLENLLTVEPNGRNPGLADALKRIGLAERTGRGIDRIYEGSLIYGKPQPDYSESDAKSVKLFIQRAVPDEAFTLMILEEKNRLGRDLPIHSLLILSLLKDERRCDVSRIAGCIHISESKVRAGVAQLVESGLVEVRGSGRGASYMLSSKVYRRTSDIAAYVRQKDIDAMRQVPLVLQFVESKGSVTRNDVCDLLHLSSPQAYRVLSKMTDSGVLVLVGKGRGAKYVLAVSKNT